MAAAEPRAGHPYKMHDMMRSQPSAIAELLGRERSTLSRIAERLAGRRRIWIVGIGTSWHAAMIVERMLSSGPEASGCNSFEFTASPPRIEAGDACIVISHRGTKRASYEALDFANERGLYTVAITSTEPGERILAADDAIRTCPQEQSAAYTVSLTTALAAAAQLEAEMSGRPDAVEPLPDLVAAALELEPQAAALAGQEAERERYVFAGAGTAQFNAAEAALKVRETSRANAEGWQIEHLLHGPFQGLGEDMLTMMIDEGGEQRGRDLELLRAASALGAETCVITNGRADRYSGAGAEVIELQQAPPLLAPIAGVVPLQLFAYHLALARGTHPDLFQQDIAGQAAAFAHFNL